MRANKKRREKYESVFIDFLETEGKKKFNEEIRNEIKLLLYDSFKNGTVNIKSTKKEQYIEDEIDW